MAGIAGTIYRDAYQADQIISHMLDMLNHRGKGEKNTHTLKNIQVGICGSPLTPYCDAYVGLDGHLYNTESLHIELKKNGVYLKENCSEEELIANAYTVWGPSFLEHIDGAFALFLLDQKKEILLLARDRFGKKPLYWYHEGNQLLFASEIKAMLASGIVPQTPALDGLASYLYFGYTPRDFSPIQGVNKLLAGYYLLCNRDQRKSIEPYWSYSSSFQQQNEEVYSRLIQHVDNLLTNAVTKCLPTKRPVGCFVSGGLGSASMAYYLQKLITPTEVEAFTVGFQGENIADVEVAEEVAKELKLQQHKEIITPGDFLNDLAKIAWFLDEPISDPSVIGTWRLASLSAPIGVVFSGMGSDELLAGHERYTVKERRTNGFAERFQMLTPLLKSFILPIMRLFSSENTFRLLLQTRTKPWQLEFLDRNALFPQHLLEKASPRLASLFDPHVFLHKFPNLPNISSRVSSFLYFDVKTRLINSFIFQYERLTTAKGLDWRTPYLTQELVEFLAKMPEPQELQPSETFKILKGIMKNVYPERILNRPKTTRRDFLNSWVEISGTSELFKKLPKGSLVELGIIDPDWIKGIISTRHLQRQYFPQLWGILMLEIWFRLYINSSFRNPLHETTIEELFKEI